jgi:glutaminyl-tRNA synthetase
LAWAHKQGYFSVDPVDSSPTALVFNRTVSLRDSWAKIEKGQQKKRPAGGIPGMR